MLTEASSFMSSRDSSLPSEAMIRAWLMEQELNDQLFVCYYFRARMSKSACVGRQRSLTVPNSWNHSGRQAVTEQVAYCESGNCQQGMSNCVDMANGEDRGFVKLNFVKREE